MRPFRGVSTVGRRAGPRWAGKFAMTEPHDPLFASEEMCKVLVESSGEAICVIDKDGVYRFMNAAGAKPLGGKPEDYIGKTLWDVFPKEIADRHAADVRHVIETGDGIVTDSR